MSEDSISATPRVDPSKIAAKELKDREDRLEARQISSDESFVESCEEAFNPYAADKDKAEKFKSLNDRRKDIMAMAKQAALDVSSSKLDDSAQSYQQRNPELTAKSLIRLLQSLKKDDSLEEILKKVQDFFPDQSLSDEALQFLIENAPEGLEQMLQDAKAELNKRFGRQIVAGKNIAMQARDFSSQGIGTPTALRDLYRDITGNPREPSLLFDQLSKAYSYEQLKTVVSFLLHSMGSDLKNKGPSIPRGELARLFSETRSLQAILGVYRFFQSRMRLINQSFSSIGSSVPQNLTFESMAKLFMKVLDDRYPASAKIIKLAQQLGIESDLLALIIVISQWRDAVRNVSPRLFKLQQQKEELIAALLRSLEELEDQKDDEENKGKE